MFFQSGGCCDGSLPMCFDDGEFVIGDHDVLLGLWVVARSTSTTASTRRGSTPSSSSTSARVIRRASRFPPGRDKHFVVRSRVFGADELVSREDDSSTSNQQSQDQAPSQRR